MQDSLISIIVPIFNVENYLAECIESIQKQTYKNLEIILIDDGSTDQSGEICEHYARNDRRIMVIHQKNNGVVAARKCGLKRARGRYIGFVDGDDYINLDMYERLIQDIENTGADFVHSGFIENNKKYIFEKKVVDLSSCRIDFLRNTILGLEDGISPSIWSKLFKADLIKKSHNHIPNDCSFGEDLLSLCNCIFECNRIAITSDYYYYYRVRNGSLSHKSDIHDLERVFKLYQYLCNIFSHYNSYPYLDDLADEFLWIKLLTYMDRISGYNFQISRFYFKNVYKLVGKKIVIYGAGKVGKDYYAQISRYSNCTLVSWIDLNPERYCYPYVKLEGIKILNTIDFDLLIVAVMKEEIAEKIYDQLINEGIDRTKIYWSKPEKFTLNDHGEISA